MGLEREMMRFKREILVGSWRRLREERVAGDFAVMVDKPRTFTVRVLVRIWLRGVFRYFSIMSIYCL